MDSSWVMLPAVAIGRTPMSGALTLIERNVSVRARHHVIGAETAPLSERPLVADRRLMNRRLRQIAAQAESGSAAARCPTPGQDRGMTG